MKRMKVMKSKRKLVSAILSALFPGVGHLYCERYIMGAVGIILTTWALLLMLVSLLIFNVTEGIGSILFPFSLYSVLGIWIVMILSLLLHDVHLTKGRTDRKIAYSAGYSMFLARNYAASLKLFLSLHHVYPLDISAGIMVALNHQRLSNLRKAEAVLKKIRKRTEEPGWLWEIDKTLAELRLSSSAGS